MPPPTTRYVFTSTSATGYSEAPADARYITIASAITAAVDGDTINIAAGTYTGSITVSKRLTVTGAGVSTIINGLVTITASGLDASNRLVISNLKVSSTTAADGIRISAATGSYYTIENVDSTGNTSGGANGIHINSTGTVSDVRIYSCTLSSNNNSGIRIASAITSMTNLDVSGCTIATNLQHGVDINPSGLNKTLSGYTFTNCTFTNNNASAASNKHQLSFFGFKGDATLTNVTVTATDTTNKAYGIVFTGNAGSSTGPTYAVAGPSGTISLTNVTVSGQVGKGALSFQAYTDVSNISLSNVNLKDCTSGWQDFIVGHTGTSAFNLADTKLKSIAVWAAGGVDATNAEFYSAVGSAAALNKASAADCATILTQISSDKMVGTNESFAALGLVLFKANTIFVRAPLASAPTSTTLLTDAINKAIGLASAGYEINVAAGSYSGGQLAINKGVSVKGAGMALTTYTDSTGIGVSVVLNKEGAALRDIKILKPHTNTFSVISLQRESSAVDAAGCSLINVEVGSSTGTALARGVAINGVSSVTVTGCTFAQTTASYSLGLASVKGATISGCTIPYSAYGSVGIFATSDTAYGAPLAADQLVSYGINLSSNTWTGPYSSGSVNVQPSTYASYTYDHVGASADVILPSSFIHSYLTQKRTSANADDGNQNAIISNQRGLADATIYGMFQASAGAGNRYVLFGRNLSSSQIFYDATFDNEENNTYGGAGAAASITTGLVSALAAPSVTAGDVLVAATAASVSALGSVDRTDLTSVQVQDRLLPVIEGLLAAADTAAGAAAPGSAGAKVADDTTLSLIEEANTEYLENDTTAGKAVIAAAIENRPNISLSVAKTASLLATLKPENVDPILTGESITLAPANSVQSGGVTTRYILEDITPGAPYHHTPMIPGEWYTLLLSTEVNDEGVPAPPAGMPLSQLKYENDKIYWRPTSDDAPTEKTLGQYYSIMRSGIKYLIPVRAKGSTTDKIEDSVPCIPAGQRILTAAGWRAVEDLHHGDMVVTDAGVAVPAKIYSSTFITSSATAPINIPAKLFGKTGNAVRLSPNHAVRLNKNIWQFPSMLLKTHAGVTQDAPGQKVTYYHIALPNYLRDNLVLEGGVVAESYGAPFAKANGLQGSKFYTYNKRLDGFTRMSYGAMANKSKTA